MSCFGKRNCILCSRYTNNRIVYEFPNRQKPCVVCNYCKEHERIEVNKGVRVGKLEQEDKLHYRDRSCPHCGRTNGLYIKRNINYDGNEGEDVMDDAYTDGGKRMYCQCCNKYVCNLDDYETIYGK